MQRYTNGRLFKFAISRRSTSHSAIKHLISGTSTTSCLYDNNNEPNAIAARSSLNDSLVQLVSSSKIGAADRLRLEMIDQGIQIRPHPIYEKAAIANIHSNNIDSFTTWFSLVPDNTNSAPSISNNNNDHHHYRRPQEPLRAIRQALLASGIPSSRLPLIMHFGLLCISKGYTQPMINEIVPLVTRFADKDAGLGWLRDLEHRAVQTQSNHSAQQQETSRWARALGVEVCVQAGWLSEAVAIVMLPRVYALPTRMYKLLVHELKSVGGMEELLEKVKKCVERDVRAPRPEQHSHLGRYAPKTFWSSVGTSEPSSES